jgi:Pheromone A receptor
MRAELPVLSFICAAILTIILSQNLRRGCVANLALVGYLLACNLLHAINSVIWADNVAIHIPVWCDIGERYATVNTESFQYFQQLQKFSSGQTSYFRQHASVYCARWKKFHRFEIPLSACTPNVISECLTPQCASCFRSFTSVCVSTRTILI